MAEAEQLTLNPSISPSGILAGHPQHEIANALVDRWAAGCSPWIGPAAGDELVVPAQQGSRRDQPDSAQRGGQQSAQCAEHTVLGIHRLSAAWT